MQNLALWFAIHIKEVISSHSNVLLPVFWQIYFYPAVAKKAAVYLQYLRTVLIPSLYFHLFFIDATVLTQPRGFNIESSDTNIL